MNSPLSFVGYTLKRLGLKRLGLKRLGLSLLCIGLLSGCTRSSEAEPPSKNQAETIAVDVAEAQLKQPGSGTAYTGSTAPIKEVALKAQIQGQLLSLKGDVGDRVQQGQYLGKVDDELLRSSMNQAQAQRDALSSDEASARSRIGEVQTQVEQARLALLQAQGNVLQLKNSLNGQVEAARLEAQQTQSNADRQANLLKSGVTTAQEAEQTHTIAKQAKQTLITQVATAQQQITQAETAVKTAQQVLVAAEAQVAIEQRNLEAAIRRVNAQESVLNQAKKQLANAQIIAPMNGVMMTRPTEVGSLLQPGETVVTLGDFSQVKVIVDISERLLSEIQVGQTTQVKLDAFGNQTLTGRVSQISPLANPSSRLLPVEIIIPNPNRNIGAGLLARVSFEQSGSPRITVPPTALQQEPRPASPLSAPSSDSPASAPASAQFSKSRDKKPESSKPESSKPRAKGPRGKKAAFQPGQSAWIFILTKGKEPRVKARSVQLGEQINGEFEIQTGLAPGEQFIVRSSRPLADGDRVQLSALSLPPNAAGKPHGKRF